MESNNEIFVLFGSVDERRQQNPVHVGGFKAVLTVLQLQTGANVSNSQHPQSVDHL